MTCSTRCVRTAEDVWKKPTAVLILVPSLRGCWIAKELNRAAAANKTFALSHASDGWATKATPSQMTPNASERVHAVPELDAELPSIDCMKEAAAFLLEEEAPIANTEVEMNVCDQGRASASVDGSFVAVKTSWAWYLYIASSARACSSSAPAETLSCVNLAISLAKASGWWLSPA